jgi:hypothetical protein
MEPNGNDTTQTQTQGTAESQAPAIETPPAPTTLDGAFESLNKKQPETSESPLGTNTQGGTEPASTGLTEPPAAIQAEDGTGNQTIGEPPANIEVSSPDTTEQGSQEPEQEVNIPALTKTLQTQALNEAKAQIAKEMTDAGVRKLTITDLYERDEKTGAVSWRNIHEADKTYADEFQAHQALDYFNKQIDDTYKQRVLEKANEFYAQATPYIELEKFRPKFNKLDQVRQQLVADIVAPYAIVGANDTVVGYSCDLNAALMQAENLFKGLGALAQQGLQGSTSPTEGSPQAEPPTTPALDLKGSHGSTNAPDAKPQTLDEHIAALTKKNIEEAKRSKEKK